GVVGVGPADGAPDGVVGHGGRPGVGVGDGGLPRGRVPAVGEGPDSVRGHERAAAGRVVTVTGGLSAGLGDGGDLVARRVGDRVRAGRRGGRETVVHAVVAVA